MQSSCHRRMRIFLEEPLGSGALYPVFASESVILCLRFETVIFVVGNRKSICYISFICLKLAYYLHSLPLFNWQCCYTEFTRIPNLPQLIPNRSSLFSVRAFNEITRSVVMVSQHHTSKIYRRLSLSLAVMLFLTLLVSQPHETIAATPTTIRVSVAFDSTQANNSSEIPSISGNGRFVAFASDATNLVIPSQLIIVKLIMVLKVLPSRLMAVMSLLHHMPII